MTEFNSVPFQGGPQPDPMYTRANFEEDAQQMVDEIECTLMEKQVTHSQVMHLFDAHLSTDSFHMNNYEVCGVYDIVNMPDIVNDYDDADDDDDDDAHSKRSLKRVRHGIEQNNDDDNDDGDADDDDSHSKRSLKRVRHGIKTKDDDDDDSNSDSGSNPDYDSDSDLDLDLQKTDCTDDTNTDEGDSSTCKTLPKPASYSNSDDRDEHGDDQCKVELAISSVKESATDETVSASDESVYGGTLASEAAPSLMHRIRDEECDNIHGNGGGSIDIAGSANDASVVDRDGSHDDPRVIGATSSRPVLGVASRCSGLINVGNSCYLISSLLLLAHIPGFSSTIFQACNDGAPSQAVCRVWKVFQHIHRPQTSRSRRGHNPGLQKTLRALVKQLGFRANRQYDAVEMVDRLLNSLNTRASVGVAAMCQFGFSLTNVDSNITTSSVANIIRIGAKPRELSFNVTSALQQSISSQMVGIEWRQVTSVPPVCLVQLEVRDDNYEKRFMPIEYTEKVSFNIADVVYHYRLNAVIVHHGLSMKNGHYTCLARSSVENQQWNCFSDNKRPVRTPLGHVLRVRKPHISQAYMLSYVQVAPSGDDEQ